MASRDCLLELGAEIKVNEGRDGIHRRWDQELGVRERLQQVFSCTAGGEAEGFHGGTEGLIYSQFTRFLCKSGLWVSRKWLQELGAGINQGVEEGRVRK